MDEAVYFCSSIAILSGKIEDFGNRILAQMQQTTDFDQLSDLGYSLAALAREVHGEQAS